jgi:hypothetical protein
MADIRHQPTFLSPANYDRSDRWFSQDSRPEPWESISNSLLSRHRSIILSKSFVQKPNSPVEAVLSLAVL